MEKKYSILVVDDDQHILDVISHLLDEESILILTAKTVADAFVITQKIDVSLLIVDYYLADTFGTELIKKVRANKPHVPVIMISAGEDTRLQSLEVGANVFLPKPFHGKELKIIIHNLLKLFDAYEQLENASDMIEALSRAVEKRDTYTQGHHARVAQYSLMIYDQVYGNEYSTEREALRVGCLLHDIGKIGTPDDILKSEDKLSEHEREKVQNHTILGYDICKDLKTLKEALPIIRSHHEKLDGSGYPDGLQKNQIPDIVCIATIADIYDALTSDRSYHKGRTAEEAFMIMETEDNGKKETLNSYFLSVFKDIMLNGNAHAIK